MASASAVERFSIREYASKMRSVDFNKCWPFGGDGGGRSLPPISVKEFSLWSDEVRDARKLDGGLELEEAAAGDGSAAEIHSMEAVLASEDGEGEDGRQAKASASASVRGKQRAPCKKRSIVELFAVAPQVEAAEEDATEEEGSDDSGDGERGGDEGEEGWACGDAPKPPDGAQVRRKLKRVKEERKGINGRKKNPKKEKGRKKKKNILAGKTEKVRNSKMSSLVNISHILQDLVHKKLFGKTSRKPPDSQRKNPVVAKNLKKKSKGKLIQPSELISSKQGEAKLLPIPGILKKRMKGNSVRKGSTSVIAHRHNLMKLCCESPKQVSYSGKDVIPGHKESCSPMEFSQLQNLCKIVSHVLAASSAMDNSSEDDKLEAVAEGDGGVDVNDKDAARSVIVREDESSPEKKQLNCSHGHIILSTHCADTEKSFVAETLDLNAALSDSDLICLNPDTSTSPPRLIYSGESNVMKNIHRDDLEHGSENHVEECYPDATSLLAPTRKCVSGSVSSLAISNTPSSQNSVSCVVRSLEGSRGHFHQSLDPNLDLLSHAPEFQAKCHLSPKDVISICSSAGSKRSAESSLTSEPGSTGKDKCIFEDFIGLPLNSQGELIQLHSGAKLGFNEIYKRQNTVPDSIQNLPIHSYVDHRSNVDHLKLKSNFSVSALNQEDKTCWFPDQYYPSSDLLGFRDLQECERITIPKNKSVRYKDRFTYPEQNSMKGYCHRCQKISQLHSGIDRMEFQAAGHLDHEFQPSIQPTMRLMGKNVTVGRSNKKHQGFDVGKSWTDKVTITENCPSVRVTNNPLTKEWPQQELVAPLACGTSKGNSLQPLGAQSSCYHMPPVLPRSGPPYFDCQPQWISRNRVSPTTENYSSKEDFFRHQVPVQVVLNETPRTIVNSLSGNESLKMTRQIPMVAPNPQNVCQHMMLSSTQCKHSQSVSYSRPSTIHPPFPNRGRIMQQPNLASSMQDLPHWLMNAKHQNNQQSYPPYSSQVAVHHSSGMLGTDHFPLLSPCPTSMIPLPIYSADAPIVCGSSMPPASVTPRSLIPSFSTNKLSSGISYKCPNKCKNISGEKSKLTYLKGLESADRSRKRLAANDDEFMKPTKKSCLSIQDDLNASASPRRGDQFLGYTQQNIALPGSYASRSEIDTSIPGPSNGNDGSRCVSGPSSKYSERPRLGPTKLTAGAKHILKPSSSVDQDCPRTIHSTISFSTGTNSDKLLVPHKKATKIYKF